MKGSTVNKKNKQNKWLKNTNGEWDSGRGDGQDFTAQTPRLAA